MVELIKTHFGHKVSGCGPLPAIPDYPVPSHEEPRFSCFVESEAAGVSIALGDAYFCFCMSIQAFSHQNGVNYGGRFHEKI